MNSELDVFLIPHAKMKQLVRETSSQVFATDFSDDFAVKGLLHSLYVAFNQFKHHEEIENKYILTKLKSRVTQSEVLEILGCIHNDTHVKDILTMVRKAMGIESGGQGTRLKDQLQSAITEFIEDFLPHMKKEEEIFQPLLSTYLSRRELQHLREEVVKLHLETSEKEPSLPSAEVTQANSLTPNNEFAILPNELLMKIFTYLSPLDLCHCAQVCRHWFKASCDGMLWQELYPLRWIFRGDWRTGIDEYELHDGSNDGSCEEDKDKWECESSYNEGESVSSGDSVEEEIDEERLERVTKQENNNNRLLMMTRYLIPRVGHQVKVLVLGSCPGLTNGLVYKMLSYCKNLEHLDLSQNNISDLGLNGLFRKNGGQKLRHLDLSGCSKITDRTLKKLTLALTPRTDSVGQNASVEGDKQSRCDERISSSRGLRYLSLSGCFHITDDGIRSFEALETKNLRVASNSFLDHLTLVMKTIDIYG
ncbi:F-box/LRR-repeat protein 5-like isoform X2 [Xenia sp. Carnegie-2017]|uniref:F-box/LRR-repeat protein 5-like isoform X2 n=1 Tax=Xenia sp. Carnegie-2017 TaxID=2897299 RepID=UPI001F0376B7|nr:F-box/LRR-repeat protein 5-like isoform X2 [Xenia sp. Carnegie-2017]